MMPRAVQGPHAHSSQSHAVAKLVPITAIRVLIIVTRVPKIAKLVLIIAIRLPRIAIRC
jgi:hypothetical protein